MRLRCFAQPATEFLVFCVRRAQNSIVRVGSIREAPASCPVESMVRYMEPFIRGRVETRRISLVILENRKQREVVDFRYMYSSVRFPFFLSHIRAQPVTDQRNLRERIEMQWSDPAVLSAILSASSAAIQPPQKHPNFASNSLKTQRRSRHQRGPLSLVVISMVCREALTVPPKTLRSPYPLRALPSLP